MNSQFSVSVLLFQEGNLWVAQGLEHDIAAQGATIGDAKRSFERVFVGQILVDIHHDKEPLSGIQAAPKKYWDMFEHGERLGDRRPFYMPPGIPPAFVIAAAAEDFRISA